MSKGKKAAREMRPEALAQASEAPQGYARPEDHDARAAPVDTAQIKRGQGGRAAPERKAGLNLRAVADVLESYGLDPIEEVAKAVMAKEPVVVNGQPVMDPDTGKVIEKHLLPIDLRVKTLIELAQYSRPKLKAVEVTVKPPELTDEQIERRLQGLLSRVSSKG